MKELELMLEAAKTISNDKIFDAVQFTIKAEAVKGVFVVVGFMGCLVYLTYKLFNFYGGK